MADPGGNTAKINLPNRANPISFVLRAELTKAPDGEEEVLPITYGDNDINYNTIDNFSALTMIAMH